MSDLVNSLTESLTVIGGQRPSEGYLVVPVGAAPRWFVGVDSNGRTVLLAPEEQASCPSVQLSHLRFEPSVRVLTVDPSGQERHLRIASIVVDTRATAVEPLLPSALAGLITAAGIDPQPGAVGRAVGALRDLFQALNRHGAASYLGVWGELLLISSAADSLTLASAWGSDPAQVFDFAVAGYRLEVKTTQQASRRHNFSYAQLLASERTSVAVASIQTAFVGDGYSVRDLLKEVTDRLGPYPEIAAHVLQRTSHGVGDLLLDPDAPRYDRELALETLAVLPFSDVPRVVTAPGVVDVTWTAQLPDVIMSDSQNPLVLALLGETERR